MKKLVLLITLMAFPSFAFLMPTLVAAAAAEEADAVADVSRQFDVKAGTDKTIKWAETNKDLIQQTLNITVLQDMGKGKFKVKRESPKGEFVWIMQETIGTTSTGKYVYKSKLVESVSGGMVYCETYVIISAADHGGTNINVKMKAGINNPDVHTRAMTIDCVNRINKCKRLMESKLN